MTKRLFEYSVRELDLMAERLRILARNKESTASTAELLAASVDAKTDIDYHARQYRRDAELLSDAANVLSQFSRHRTGGQS